MYLFISLIRLNNSNLPPILFVLIPLNNPMMDLSISIPKGAQMDPDK